MTDSRWWQPAVYQAPHAVPSDTAFLAASRKHAVPSPAHLSPESAQRRAIHGHPIVAGMPTNNRAELLAHFAGGIMHVPPELDLHFAQLHYTSPVLTGAPGETK
jgi:acyl dehydratase